MTLDDLIQLCVTDCDETPLNKTDASSSVISTAYTGDALTIAKKFKNAINFAYRKIAREKYWFTHSETMTLDADLNFLSTGLTYKLLKITRIENSDEDEVFWTQGVGSKIKCSYNEEGDVVTVFYRYIPADLTALTDEPAFPEGKVDHRTLCYYADFEFLTTETDAASRNRAQTWLALFNGGFKDIDQGIGEPLKWDTDF